MGQVESTGEFSFDPDEWEHERSTGHYRPRRRSADARPFARPRTPLQFGTVPTALPVNPADYVDTNIRRRMVDLDAWDAKLGTDEYIPSESSNVVGVDAREDAQRAEQRYEDYLDLLFPRPKQQGCVEDATIEGSFNIHHPETESSVAKPKLDRPPLQAELPANRKSKRNRSERSSSENITPKQSSKVDEPAPTSTSYENLMDRAFPKRKAQMQQRHQRQQQQLQKLPDPPKPPAYRNPNIKPENIKRSASTTLLLDSKKRSASLGSLVTSPNLGPQIQPSTSGSTASNQKRRCACTKCSGDASSTELHKPPSPTGNTPNTSTPPTTKSPTNPIPGRITVDMHLRVRMDLPSPSSLTTTVPTPQHPLPKSSFSFQSQSHPTYSPEFSTPPYNLGSPSHGLPQYPAPTNSLANRASYNTPVSLAQYGNQQQAQSPHYFTQSSQQQHHHRQSHHPLPQPPNVQNLFRSHQSQQLSYNEIEQQQAAYARAHLAQLSRLHTQAGYGRSTGTARFSPGGYTISPGPNTPVHQFGQFGQHSGQQYKRGSGQDPGQHSRGLSEQSDQQSGTFNVKVAAPRMQVSHPEADSSDEEEEEEEEDDDDDDPYHDKRYGDA